MRKYSFFTVLLIALALGFLPGWGAASPGDLEKERAQAEQEEQTWTVAVMADMNGSYGSVTYNNHVHAAVEWVTETLRPDLVVSPGDLVAGQRRGLDYAAMWAGFHDAVTDKLAAAEIPLAVTPGNHDASGFPAFWQERIQFAREWQVRRPQLTFVDDTYYPFHYAFTLGPALFISLDGTQVGPLDAAQRHWVERVLKENAHKPVKFVFSHVPLFSVAQGRENEFLNDRRLEELFEFHGVDMMITGHHHAYYPGHRGATKYLHAACLGGGPRALIGESERSSRSVAVIRFNSEGIVDVEAYVSPRFDSLVELESLPPSIGEGEQQIWRIDVAQE